MSTTAQGAALDHSDVLGLILRHAQDRPTELAVRDDHQSLSYGELYERVAATAAGLTSLGIGLGDRVAIYLDNSAVFVTLALGCLWVGAPFVPLSVDDPAARVATILQDCDPAVIVVPSGPGTGRFPEGAVDTIRTVGTDRVPGVPTLAPRRSLDDERDAYFIYTSGTTGFPKGVRIQERAFRHAVVNAAEVLGLDATTRALCVSSFHFDGSYGNLFPTLVGGGALVIPRREELLYLKRFYSSLLEDGINHTSFSPSYLRLLLSGRGLPALAGSQLRTMALGGEECVAEDVARLWELLPGLRVFNRYGPTETTIAVTTYEVTPSDVASGKVPIGSPHPGVSFWLVGEDGALIDRPNETGELYIGGEQLMRGYWGDDQLSESVLRRDVVPGEVVYKTGDLVYRDTRGLFVYEGRSDDVMKRNGVRISLNEVALALRRVEGVAGAVCLAVAGSDRVAIVAFVAAAPGVTEAEVGDGVKDFLPPSMAPDELVLVSSLPMTPSGKVDRQRLLADATRFGWQSRTT